MTTNETLFEIGVVNCYVHLIAERGVEVATIEHPIVFKTPGVLNIDIKLSEIRKLMGRKP